MKKLKIGFCGTGWISDWYKKALNNQSNRYEFAACCGNPSEEGQKRLREKCSSWGVEAYPDFSSMLKDDSIDCIGIFSPTSFHFDQAVQALESGKHILVEKPVTIDSKQMKILASVAEKNNCILFPGHNFVYRPVIQRAKEIIESGALGRISYASFRAVHFIPDEHASGWRKDFKSSGGGAMMDSGTHLVYQLLYLLGKPEQISCYKANNYYLHLDGEDTCLISLQYEDRKIAQVFQSWSSGDDSGNEILIQGCSGSIRITDALYHDGKLITDDSSYEKSFYHTLKAFHNSIVNGSAVVSDINSARLTLDMIQTAYRAADKKEIISL